MTASSFSQDRLLALVLELPSRAAAAESLDELYFILTNDLRTLVEFDRCFLITHLDGESRFVSATLQPVLEGKSRLQHAMTELSGSLLSIDQPMVLGSDSDVQALAGPEFPDQTVSALLAYKELAGWRYLCCIPLTYEHRVLGHLLMEWFGDNLPDKNAVMALVKLAPVFGAAMATRWLIARSSRSAELLRTNDRKGLRRYTILRKYIPASVVAVMVLALVFFIVPFTFWVGGEAVVAPKERHFAFCKLSGLIDTVDVRQGSRVKQGQKIASLDSRELELRIRREERQLEMLSKEMALQKSRAIDDPSMLAKIKTMELKKESVQAELDFLCWQRQFLVITAPVNGVVVSKDVETYVGKRLEGGDAFCEIGELGNLCTEIYVSEDRILRVKSGQEAFVYLNSAPRKGYRIVVQEVAPRSEVQARLGNVYKVTATFIDPPKGIKGGMKGIGSIDTGTANLWTMIGHRLAERWNQAWLHFW